jgi:hypothetical protein
MDPYRQFIDDQCAQHESGVRISRCDVLRIRIRVGEGPSTLFVVAERSFICLPRQPPPPSCLTPMSVMLVFSASECPFIDDRVIANVHILFDQ